MKKRGERTIDRDEAIERTLARIVEDGVILCIRLGPGFDPVASSLAAVKGGLKIIEMTLTTPGALDAITKLSADPSLLVGAGTVLEVKEVEEAARAGAKFAMSPVFDSEVVQAAHSTGILAIPGCATPGEVLSACRCGAKIVKIFPSGSVGGAAFIKALRGPLPDIPLLPTSGPDSTNIAEYMEAGATAVGVGAELFVPGFNLESIEEAARRTRKAMERYRRET